MKRNKKSKYLIFVLSFILLVLIGIIFYLNFSSPLEIFEFDVKFSVGDEIGIIINGTELNYGTLSHGMSSTKKIKIENTFDFDILAKIYIDRNLEDYVFGEESVVVSSGESIEYLVKLVIPSYAEYGDYTGKIKLEIRKKESL